MNESPTTTPTVTEDEDDASCTDFRIVVLACLGWAFITIVLLLFNSCRFITEFNRSQKNPHQSKSQKTNKRYFWTCFATICGLCMGHITLSTTMIFCYFGNGLLIYITSMIHLLIFWASGVALIVMFIIRLKKVFANAVVYAYSNRTFHILATLVGSMIILGLGTITTFFFQFYQYAFGIALLGVIVYLGTAIFTLYLFVYGLYRVQSYSRTNSSLGNVKTNISDDDLTNSQKNLISVMSKYCVLVALSLFTTFITTGILVARIILFQSNKWNLILYFSYFSWELFDTVVNSLCLMAQFNFYGKKFYKKYCSKLDNFTKRVFTSQVVKGMNWRRQQHLQHVAQTSAHVDLENMDSSTTKPSVDTPNVLPSTKKIYKNSLSATDAI